MAQKKACYTNAFSLPSHTPHCHLSWRLCSLFCLGSSPSDQQPCRRNTGLPAFVPYPSNHPCPPPPFPSWPSSGNIEPFPPGQRCLLCSDPLLSCPTCSSVSGTLRGNQQECMIPGLSFFGKAGVTAAQLLLSPACTLCKPVPCCHSWLMRPTDQLPPCTTQWKSVPHSSSPLEAIPTGVQKRFQLSSSWQAFLQGSHLALDQPVLCGCNSGLSCGVGPQYTG